jgi:hypothetical protein
MADYLSLAREALAKQNSPSSETQQTDPVERTGSTGEDWIARYLTPEEREACEFIHKWNSEVDRRAERLNSSDRPSTPRRRSG